MELSDLKGTWNTLETPVKSINDIKLMLSENRHPVLKHFKKQLTVEIAGWCILLACYYTMFDGDSKPVWLNMVLVISILLALLHNLMGYRFAKHLLHGTNIRESLNNYISRVKVYAAVSIACRFFFIAGLLVFFIFEINFTTKKIITLTVIIMIFLIQLFILYRLWMKRLKRLENTVAMFI